MHNPPTSQLEIWHMHWILLHVAVQLDQRWSPTLRPQSEAAALEALSIARKLGRFERDFASLGELRKHLVGQILETGSTLADGLSCQGSEPSQRLERHRRCAEDILFIARMLERAVDLDSCRFTGNDEARQVLWSSIATTSDRSEPAPSGHELVRHACTHAIERLEDWFKEESAPRPAPLVSMPIARADRSHTH